MDETRKDIARIADVFRRGTDLPIYSGFICFRYSQQASLSFLKLCFPLSLPHSFQKSLPSSSSTLFALKRFRGRHVFAVRGISLIDSKDRMLTPSTIQDLGIEAEVQRGEGRLKVSCITR